MIGAGAAVTRRLGGAGRARPVACAHALREPSATARTRTQSSAVTIGAPPLDWDPNDPDAVNVLYDVSAWSVDQRAELAAAFADAGHPHAWEGDELVVPEQIEDAVDELFDRLERELGPFPVGLAADGAVDRVRARRMAAGRHRAAPAGAPRGRDPAPLGGFDAARRPGRRTRRRRPPRCDRVGRPGDARRRSRRGARGRPQPAVHGGRSTRPRSRRRHRPQRAVRPRRSARRAPAPVRRDGAGVEQRRHRDADTVADFHAADHDPSEVIGHAQELRTIVRPYV